MKRSKILKCGFTMALAILCVGGLASCSDDSSESSDASVDMYDTSEGVAATVNGTEIGEKCITAYIEDIRTANGLEDDSDWAQWLVDNDYTPEDIRSEVVDYYCSQQLLRQACDENDVTVDSDEIDSQVETMRSYYDSDEDWDAALQSVGMTEDSYRNLLELSALEDGLMDAVATVTEPSDDDMLTYGQMYAQAYDGAKKSSQILFSADDEETAQEVLDEINAGEIDFADAAEQYSIDSSSASDGGNVGWDCLNSFVDEYQDALDELDEGEVSGLVTSSYGIHIIECTEVFNAPDEVTSTDQLPDEFVESIRTNLEDQSKEDSFSEWFSDYEESADIEVNDMPDGLSYDVDLTGYTKTEDDSTSDDTTDETTDETTDTDEDTDESTTTEDDASSEDSSDATDEESTDDSTSDEEATDESTDSSSDSSSDSLSSQPTESSTE